MPPTQTSDSASNPADTPALGARENWWGQDVDDTTPEQHGEEKYRDYGQGDEWGVRHTFTQGVDPAETIAFDILREYGGTSEICGRTLLEDPWNGGRLAEQFAWLFQHEPDQPWPIDGHGDQLHTENRVVELSAPDLMPSWLPAAQCKHRRRYQPDTGYINWNESTWVLLADTDKDQFLAAVREWLARNHPGLRECEQRQAINLASSRKSDPSLDDVEALAEVVRRVRAHTDPSEPADSSMRAG